MDGTELREVSTCNRTGRGKARAVQVAGGHDWFHAPVLPLNDMDPFVPGRLLPAFRAAASGGMQQLVDHRLLQECLCIEVAGPERGHLVTAVEV